MEIAPVSVDDVRVGRDGRRYLVTSEAGSVVKQLQEIDPRVFVEFHEPPRNQGDGFYSVCLRVDDHKSDIIFRTASLDGRVVERLRRLNFELRHGISPADRMEHEDAQAARDREYRRSQEVRANAEPLMHAIQRTVLGIRPNIFMHRSEREKRAT